MAIVLHNTDKPIINWLLSEAS